jgi:L-cysteine:1D-myo-inositol 2-amino-2-deoxy-alpha-D-glucopyranoside ligase
MRSWAAPEISELPGRGLPLRVYDTASQALHPLAPGPIATMYVCGITPYDATHLGHAATYVTFDILGRALRDSGHPVRYVQNVTDVDDPLLERATQTGEDWRAIARRETELFRTDMEALRVLPPEHYVGAVESIPLALAMIQRLVELGAAYTLDGDVYFAVDSADRLGDISGLDRVAMIPLARENGGDPDRPGKKNPLDALMWRAQRPGEPSWPSPFGPGRPGWHIECAAIAAEHLGTTIDIQGGGIDLVFPHHEMSAAHVNVASGSWPFARAYVHQAMIGFDGHKMSKSRGNLVLVSALRAAGVDPMAIRLALLAHDHRHAWEWTDADLTRAERRLASWRGACSRLSGSPADATLTAVRSALAEGLDCPGALVHVDDWVAETSSQSYDGLDPGGPALIRALADALLGVAL